MKEPAIQTGFLVLADLSGFTPFVAGSEVAHAQSILANVLGVLRRHMTPMLRLAEVEGDALFLYARDSEIHRGETLLEMIERTYVAFRDQQQTMQHNAVCPCQACQMIPGLDLKFVTHHGEFVLQDLAGAVKPFGSCVNLAHRLLKNDITGNTGWPAYALFTEPALERMGVRPDGMHTESVSYPHLGEWTVNAIDLRQRYVELSARRFAFLTEDDAHYTLHRRFAVPTPRLWELLTDPSVRNIWEVGSDWSVLRRSAGRSGAGSQNHCANSGFIEEVLDWRPFDYYTVIFRYGAIRFRATVELNAAAEGTDVRWSMALENLLPGPLRRSACRFFVTRLMRTPDRFERLDGLIAAELAAEFGPTASAESVAGSG